MNKTAHQWLGWAMVAGVLHVLLNINAFKRHLAKKTGRWGLTDAPLSIVAQVAGLTTTQTRKRLSAARMASQK